MVCFRVESIYTSHNQMIASLSRDDEYLPVFRYFLGTDIYNILQNT